MNALSLKIDDVEKADSVGELEGSMAYSEMASCGSLLRDRRQQHGIERIVPEPGRAFMLLIKAHFGIVRLNNPGRYRWYVLPEPASRITGHR